MEDDNERFYIGGKAYIPAESAALCIVRKEGAMLLDEVTTLYRTQNGAFFTVKNDSVFGITVELIDSDAAFKFMDENAAGINTRIYDMVFGQPERG